MSETAPQTIAAEGSTLEEALQQAATALGVSPSMVEYKFDLAHFRSAAGRAIGVDTVRVIAWASSGNKPGKPASTPANTAGTTAAKAWLETLLQHMGMKGEVFTSLGRGGENRGILLIKSPDARFLVGRQGATLQAIVELLEAAMAIQQPDWQFRVDVDSGDRPERGERPDRGDRPERGDRPDRGERRDFEGRGRREDRRGPPRRDGPSDDRGGPGADDRRRTEQDLEKLRRLALRLAAEVARTGEPTEIHRELNSYERRVVHMAVSEVEGVASESVGDGVTKQIRLFSKNRPAPRQEEDLTDAPTQE